MTFHNNSISNPAGYINPNRTPLSHPPGYNSLGGGGFVNTTTPLNLQAQHSADDAAASAEQAQETLDQFNATVASDIALLNQAKAVVAPIMAANTNVNNQTALVQTLANSSALSADTAIRAASDATAAQIQTSYTYVQVVAVANTVQNTALIVASDASNAQIAAITANTTLGVINSTSNVALTAMACSVTAASTNATISATQAQIATNAANAALISQSNSLTYSLNSAGSAAGASASNSNAYASQVAALTSRTGAETANTRSWDAAHFSANIAGIAANTVITANSIANALGGPPLLHNESIHLTGDVTGIGSNAIVTVLANSGATAGTYNGKITVDVKGRVTAGAALANTDVTVALGFTPANKAGDTFTGTVFVGASNATTTNSFLVLRPTDWATGKPEFYVNKGSSAGSWAFGIFDGVNANGTLDIAAQNLTWNGAPILSGITSGMVTTALGYTPANKAGDTFTSAIAVQNGNATTVSRYYTLSPTDVGTGKPYLYVNKAATALNWEIGTNDGTGPVGNINIATTALTLNGAPLLTGITSGQVTTALGYTPVSKTGDTMSGGLTMRTGSNGYSVLNPGGTSTSGYLASHNASATRIGYMGFYDATNLVGAMTDSTTNLLFGVNGATQLSITGTTGVVAAITSFTAPSVTETSDMTSKTKEDDISDETSFAFITELFGFTYTFNDTGAKLLGLSAQAVQQLESKYGLDGRLVAADENGKLSLSYGRMMAMVGGAMRYQQAQADARFAALEDRLRTLEAKAA